MLAEIVLDIALRPLFWFVDTEMALTEYIGLEFQEFVHGFSPLADVRLEFPREGTVDILPEEYSVPLSIDVNRYGARCMARCVNAVENIRSAGNDLLLPI
jgi:hypothetical protein